MKKLLILSLAFFLPGCVGPDVSNFIGGTWTGTESTTANEGTVVAGGQSCSFVMDGTATK